MQGEECSPANHGNPGPGASHRPLTSHIRWRLLGCSVHRSGFEWLGADRCFHHTDVASGSIPDDASRAYLRGRRTVFVKAGTGGRHDSTTASIEPHSGMNARWRVTGSSTVEPQQHHSTPAH